MAESEEIQRHLREKTGRFILKAPTNLKSEIWQKFHMVFQKKENDDSEIPVNYYCACIKCNKISAEEKKFKRNLMADLDVWMMTELDLVANKMRQRRHAAGTESRVAGTSAQQDVEDDYTQPTKKARFDPFADIQSFLTGKTIAKTLYFFQMLPDECYASLPVQHNLKEISVQLVAQSQMLDPVCRHEKLKNWN
ncbi:hypothetical protein HELRODRAFT_178552 [Helobdella robusta]|uniref:Uncharacterized protein n=1 Tax=Helobdella robusta TaxID=6412 RepID=T1FDD0_HELRO|nr:hypothetical protein HELRODRAFT_178552 [Helobdella robusta]ESN97101.1 hypothetical protein HELRODRAFT_178552 [Helobdella robusta]